MRQISCLYASCALLLLCAGCASNDPHSVVDAASTPLHDLNLIHAEIPVILQAAQKNPYGLGADASCSSLSSEIGELDTVLGADLDAPTTPKNPSIIERGTDEFKNAAVGAVQRSGESVIPFRAWVRKLTGAERYSKKVAAAIVAGTVRRAFLKGVRFSKSCEVPGV